MKLVYSKCWAQSMVPGDFDTHLPRSIDLVDDRNSEMICFCGDSCGLGRTRVGHNS